MSRVFVVQNTHRMDQTSGQLVPKFDLSPAKKHGELIFLTSPTARPHNPEHLISEIREKLQDYRADSDHLLLIGSPVLIGIAFAVAADADQGRVSVLQWDGKRREYVAVTVDMGGVSDRNWRDTWR